MVAALSRTSILTRGLVPGSLRELRSLIVRHHRTSTSTKDHWPADPVTLARDRSAESSGRVHMGGGAAHDLSHRPGEEPVATRNAPGSSPTRARRPGVVGAVVLRRTLRDPEREAARCGGAGVRDIAPGRAAVLSAPQPHHGTGDLRRGAVPPERAGDFHPNLDKPDRSVFDIADLRLRVTLRGRGVCGKDLGGGMFSLAAGERRAVVHTAPGEFLGQSATWDIDADGDEVAAEVVLYAGPRRLVDFHTAVLCAGLRDGAVARRRGADPDQPRPQPAG